MEKSPKEGEKAPFVGCKKRMGSLATHRARSKNVTRASSKCGFRSRNEGLLGDTWWIKAKRNAQHIPTTKASQLKVSQLGWVLSPFRNRKSSPHPQIAPAPPRTSRTTWQINAMRAAGTSDKARVRREVVCELFPSKRSPPPRSNNSSAAV